MASEWYYFRGDVEHGPVSSEQMKELAAHGQLTPSDLVWRKGMTERVFASRLKVQFGISKSEIDQFPQITSTSTASGSAGSERQQQSVGEEKPKTIGEYVVMTGILLLIGGLSFSSFFHSTSEQHDKASSGGNSGGTPSSNMPFPLVQPQGNRANFDYCLAVLRAEDNAHLNGSHSFDEVTTSADSLFFALQAVDTTSIDRRFVNWSERYCNLLVELKSVAERLASRSTDDYQMQKVIESVFRGYEGDPFGTALDEAGKHDVDVSEAQRICDQRLQLLVEFKDLYNEVAPAGQHIHVSK